MLNYKIILFVFLGGGLGSLLRYLLGYYFGNASFPYATLFINIAACLILGFSLQYFALKSVIDQYLKLLVQIGFCGGFSTFSTYSAEGIQLWKNGEVFAFFTYFLLTNIFCFLAIILGGQFCQILQKG